MRSIVNQRYLLACRIALTLSAVAVVATPQSSSFASERPSQKIQDERLRPPFGVVLPGEDVRAFLVAYTSFTRLPGMTHQSRDLTNYDVELRMVKGRVFVGFLPRLVPGEVRNLGCCTSRGVGAAFLLDTRTFKIISQSTGGM